MTKEEYEAKVEQTMEQVPEKYGHPGIYCIKLKDMMIYIGKSRNMRKRVAQHIVNTEVSDKNMYKVMKQLLPQFNLSFGIMYVSEMIGQDKIDDDIGYAEAYAINKYEPCLNIQYPKLDNYHSCVYKGRGKTITANEVIALLEEGE